MSESFPFKRWRCRHWHRWFRLRGESTWVRDACRHCAVELPSPFGEVSGSSMSNTYNHRGRLIEQKWEPPVGSIGFLAPRWEGVRMRYQVVVTIEDEADRVFIFETDNAICDVTCENAPPPMTGDGA